MAAPAPSSKSASITSWISASSQQQCLSGRVSVRLVLQGGGSETEVSTWESQLRKELNEPELRLVSIIRCCDKCPEKGPDLALSGFVCQRCHTQWDSCIGMHPQTERICVGCGHSDTTQDICPVAPMQPEPTTQPPPYSSCNSVVPVRRAVATLFTYHGSNQMSHLGELLASVEQLKKAKQLTIDPEIRYEEIATDSGAVYAPPKRSWWNIATAHGEILSEGRLS